LHGYDHETEPQAELMEGLETAIVTKLGYPSPYLII
jgi:probable rRNA maturation factor